MDFKVLASAEFMLFKAWLVHSLNLETITFLTTGIEKVNVFSLYYVVYIFKKMKIRIYCCYNLL